MAYVIQSDNLSILEQFGDRKILSESNLLIKQFVLRNSQDQIIRSIELDDWHAIKRETIIEYLVGQLKQYELITNSHFSHFVKEGDDVKAAVFKDGSIEMGDLFIGADGIHSAVRGNVCNAEFYPNEIDELVCLVDYRVKGDPYPTFTKYHEEKQGLAFGIVPVSETQSVWFNQYLSLIHI